MRDPKQFSRVIKELSPKTKFYWAYQDGLRLTPPFTLLDILSDDIVGMGEHPSTVAPRNVDRDSGYFGKYAEVREVVVRVSFYGTFTSSSYGDARYLMALLRSFRGRSALHREGLSFVSVSSLGRVNVSGDTTPYVNNFFDITLRYKSIIEVDLDPVEEVGVTHHLTVETDLGDPDDEFTITGTNTYTR